MKLLRTVLLGLSALVLAGCRQPEPPVVPEPVTFPTTEISGTLSNWAGGAAFVTLTAGYSSTSGPEGEVLELTEPLYPGAVSAEGAFKIALTVPAEGGFFVLGCTATDPAVAQLSLAAASNVATPIESDELLGFYASSDPSMPGRQGAWLYVKEAYRAKTDCTVGLQTGLAAIDLTLAPGWNQVIVNLVGTTVTLTSGAVPDTFVWSTFVQ